MSNKSWRKQLEEIGGYDNELMSVPAGVVRKIIRELENACDEIDQLRTHIASAPPPAVVHVNPDTYKTWYERETTKDKIRDASCLDAGCDIDGKEPHKPTCDHAETEQDSVDNGLYSYGPTNLRGGSGGEISPVEGNVVIRKRETEQDTAQGSPDAWVPRSKASRDSSW